MIRTLPRSRLEGLLEGDRGLSAVEAESSRARHGRNDIVEVPPGGPGELLRSTVRDPMLWFLLVASVLFGALGEHGEAATLLVALVPLVGMDVWLHRRVHASTRGLAKLLATRARVVRDGVEVEIPSLEVVPGDLAVVAPGETFPADGVIVGGEELNAEESSLTGEAWPVPKRPLSAIGTRDPEPRVDALHWGFAGTRLLTGRARVRIAWTGSETLYGEIVRSASTGPRARTELQRAISRLVAFLLAAAVIACLGLAWVRLRQGHGAADALASALALAVAALPEEFPVVFTIFLGVGVLRLARRRALVRRAAAVEGIGRITCLCSDKTGTITEGRLRMEGVEPAPGTSPDRLRLLAAVASMGSAHDPLDEVVLAAVPSGAARSSLVAEYPFTEARRRATVVARESSGALIAAVKGAPESILPVTTLDVAARKSWMDRAAARAAEGRKVLACGSRMLEEPSWRGDEPDGGFDFAGLLVFDDPLRQSAPEAVALVREAGIRFLLVTGDHPESAGAVARRIGLGDGNPRVSTGDDLELRLDREGPAATMGIDVLARALPGQKVRLVRALQACGEAVAVTGDGVNDVPALQCADVGIAMGGRGTRSAREAAAIVLLDDDLRTIAEAVGEGRQLFENLQRSFAYLLTIHAPLVLSAALVPLAGFPLLYLPVHVVWLELIIHPTALLAFQGADPGRRARTPRRRVRSAFFDARGWVAILASAAALTVLLAAGLGRSLGLGMGIEHVRTMALVELSCASAALAAALSQLATRMSRFVVFGTIAATLALVQVPALAALLHLQSLRVGDWLVACAGGAIAVLPLLLWMTRRR